MQVSSNKPQSSPHKVKNILIRHSHKVKYDKDYQHPEVSYILKYAPKYYKSLAFEITDQNPLLSKVKNIKKLQKFTGFFKEHFPQKLWFNLLNNNRKEIEEIPQISPSKFETRPSESFWRKFNLRKIKFFLNMTKVSLSRWKVHPMVEKFDNLFSIKEHFVRYFEGLTKLKSLEVLLTEANFEKAKWILGKLNGMGRFINRLETLTLDVRNKNLDIQGLSQYKNIFSLLTGLSLSEKFDPAFCAIPQISKNLNSLSLHFQDVPRRKSEFPALLTHIQSLSQLKSLALTLPPDFRQLWSHFKPQPFLKNLKLEFSSSNLTNEALSEGNTEAKDALDHWEEIKELDTLELHVSCEEAEDIVFVRRFITVILKKVCKVRSLMFWMSSSLADELTYEPFLVEEVPHLYESLEKFGHELYNWETDDMTKFNLKIVKPFRNLKEIKLKGNTIIYENVEEAVSLLEASAKEGDYPTLELIGESLSTAAWLRETLKKIAKVKKLNTSLRILMNLSFKCGDCIDLLEGLCQGIQAVKTIKGVAISLNLEHDNDISPLPTEELQKLCRKYIQINNLRVFVSDGFEGLEYVNVDGEKQKFVAKSYA